MAVDLQFREFCSEFGKVPVIMFVARPRCRILALCAALAASGSGGVTARPLVLADNAPHGGVARAHAMPVQGIDVSQWQGDIDWQQARAAGTQFAFIKATEGGDHLDPKFQQNWEGAKRAGVPRGAYHMLYWCRPAQEQALWFILNVPFDPDALPPVLDLEWNHASRNCPGEAPSDEALQKIKIMLEVMEAHTGKRPIIYTDVAFHRDVLEGELKDYNFWLRSVAAEPEKRYRDRPWLYWQFTTTGHVPGIQGPVDRNTFNGSVAAWAQVLPARTSRR
jgi:lysozyme